MKKLVLVVAAGIMLSGCSHKELNNAIMKNNETRETNFGVALANCKGERGCLVGVSMAYAGRIGQQQLYKPETALDYATALGPLVITALNTWYGGGSGGGGVSAGDDSTIYIMRDNDFKESENYVQLQPTHTNTPSWITSSNNPVTN